MEIELLRNIVVVFTLSVIVLFIFHRIRAPTIVGFLLTGVLAGPQGLGLIQASAQVADLAEMGVIMLLFTVGIEISLKDLLRLKKYVLVGGSLQVLLTIIAVFVFLVELGRPAGEAMLFGFLISLSSTAIVLRIIQSADQFDSLYGRTTLGMLIFQDIIVVPMMLITPLLPGGVHLQAPSPVLIMAKGLGLLALVIISAKWIVPRVLYHITKTGDRELFLLTIIAICLAVAWMSSVAGLSLGLGAFLAGLIISDSPYSHQAFGNVLPLRDAFTSFFFISIGMLLDLNFLLEKPGYIILVALGVMAAKALISSFVISIMGLPLRIAVLVGLALCQIGEFSFILSKVGFDSGILPASSYQLFLEVVVLTMGATSFLMAASPKVADGFLRLPFPSRLKNRQHPPSLAVLQAWKDHLIIVGYGVNGRNLARSAKAESIPFVIVEMDPEIVRREGTNGEPISYGDATQETVLLHVGIREAKVMVIAISDPAATRRIVQTARKLNPGLSIIARTRYLEEMKPLQDLGADVVIPEEYETSVEIFSRVLRLYNVPSDEIESFTAQIRADGYQMFRSLSWEPYCDADVSLITEEIGTFRVCNGSIISGKRVSDLALGGYGATLLAVHRNMQTIARPPDDFQLETDDVVIIMGPKERLAPLGEKFQGK